MVSFSITHIFLLLITIVGKLEELNLSHNPLQVIPVEVGNLELLAELGQWEIGISFLNRLQRLNVSHCQLSAWPPQVSSLPELQHLDLSHNQIREVPGEVADLLVLRSLRLSSNGLQKLAPEVYSMQKLEELDLSHNCLVGLPEPIPSNLSNDPVERCMERLRLLDISHNQLTVLDDLLGIFSRLETLDASWNSITCFHGESISKLTTLSVLDISHNQLEVFPDGLRSCVSLTHFKATHNKLGFVPESFVHTTKLVSIDLSFNEISDAAGKIFAMLSHLRTLLLHHNRTGPLPAMLYTTRHLEHLDLSYNEIPIIAEGLGQLSSLTYLNLAFNRITSLPDTISSLTQLHTLELESNRLTDLPATLSKLYSKLSRMSLCKNDFVDSPGLLTTLPLLMSCNLSWNPRLRSQWVDWQKAAAEYKPKKTFITPQILRRRINQTVDRLDAVILAARPAPHPESLYCSAQEAQAARAAEEDADINNFQNTIANDDPMLAVSDAASVKAAQKARTRGIKKLKQSFEWHGALRAHILQFSFRQPSSNMQEGRQRSVSQVFSASADSNGSVQDQISNAVLPTVQDLRQSQSSRLTSHMYSLFKMLDKHRGGTPIGMSWQEALRHTEEDILQDTECTELLADLPIGAELQDSVEALQYLINEVDALLMVTEMRHMLDCHAARMHQLRVQLKEDEAVRNIAPAIKSRLTVLSEVARKAVHDRHIGDIPHNIDDIERPSSSVEPTAENALDGAANSAAVLDTDYVTQENNTVQLEHLQRNTGFSDADVSAAEGDDVMDNETKSIKIGRSFATSARSSLFGRSGKSGKSRKEIAEDQVDLLALNVKVNVKASRVVQSLAEEAAQLAHLIADMMNRLQKPQLAVDFGGLPYLAFSAMAVEGVFPGIGALPFDRQEPLLALLVECALHLMKTLLRRCDSLRDAIRILEVRGKLRVSCLDIAQRAGDDFLDHMADIHDDLCGLINLKENDGGNKPKSIFGKKNNTSTTLTAAIAENSPVPLDPEDGDEAESCADPDTGKTAQESNESGKPELSPSSEAKVPLSALLPPIDPTREVISPVATTTARKCIRHLASHRVLTLMWTSYIAEVVGGVLKRRGVDPHYPHFLAHSKHEFNFTPEWVTRSAARLAQFRGLVYSGLCIYYKAVEELTACTKFSLSARSFIYYLSMIKLHISQGSFLLARDALNECLRSYFAQQLPAFDLSDETAMPEPLDLLPVCKELALLQAIIDAGVRQLDSAGIFTSSYSKFLCVQRNGLLSGSNRVPLECQRGLTLHQAVVIKARQLDAAGAAGRLREQQEREQTRTDLKNHITETRLKYTRAMNEL